MKTDCRLHFWTVCFCLDWPRIESKSWKKHPLLASHWVTRPRKKTFLLPFKGGKKFKPSAKNTIFLKKHSNKKWIYRYVFCGVVLGSHYYWGGGTTLQLALEGSHPLLHCNNGCCRYTPPRSHDIFCSPCLINSGLNVLFNPLREEKKIFNNAWFFFLLSYTLSLLG